MRRIQAPGGIQCRTEAGARTAVERSAAAGRIFFVLVCVVIAEWIFPLAVRRPPAWAFNIPVAVIMIFGVCLHKALHEGASELGLRLDNLPVALRLLAFPMLWITLALTLAAYALGSLRIPRLPGGWLSMLAVLWLFWWGFLQQYALQAIVNRQAQRIWGKGFPSVLFVALIFGGLHMPNPALVIATFAGGCLWASVYQRTPNLFALAMSHAMMSMLLIWALPPSALHGMRVGLGYYY